MLKDLQLTINRLKEQEVLQAAQMRAKQEIDTDIACNIIEILFKHVIICLKEDKSKVKLNKLEKSFIQSIINERTVNGIKEFIRNMENREINTSLTDIQKELLRRQDNYVKI